MAEVTPTLKQWQVGDTLPDVVHGPLTRGDFALFAGASGDHVLLHIDSDYAKAAGFDDVFAQGMLSMAFMAQVLTSAFAPSAIREWSTRFLAVTPLYATVRCGGTISEVLRDASGTVARIDLHAAADGVQTLLGSALVNLDLSPTQDTAA